MIPEAELVKLCSVEQHLNHIDETFRQLGLGGEMRNEKPE